MMERRKVKVKGNPISEQTFQAEFNELLFISIALKLNPTFMDFLSMCVI
jgi:hypothetical protein